MSLCPGKYCLRYSRVLFKQWGGAPSWWNTTVFISMLLFLLNAGTNFHWIISMYRSGLMVTRFSSLSSKKYVTKISPVPKAHYNVTFSWLNGRWVCIWGCWDAQSLMFCLLTCPLKWKWASSLKRIKPRYQLGCSQFFHWWFDKIHSFLPYWHQFVFGEFALCMETILSHCEWFFAQSFLKCRLPKTVVVLTFVVIVQDASLLPEH